jgi:hypothetical protein
MCLLGYGSQHPSRISFEHQIGIHIVPTCGDKTWETKGSQNVKVHGMEDKRQIICGNIFSC